MAALPKAILFDLDDTLIRAYAQPEEAWTRLERRQKQLRLQQHRSEEAQVEPDVSTRPLRREGQMAPANAGKVRDRDVQAARNCG